METKLGNLIEGEQHRDAIHVAVIPMKANELLRPGQRVGLIGDGAGPSDKCVGIVDPFLTDVVAKGATFWLLLLPDTVTGMRHHWEHPEFKTATTDNPAAKEAARLWILEQCEPLGCDFDELTDPRSRLLTGDYMVTYQNEDARDHWYGIEEEFWKQLEIYSGIKTEEKDRGGFSCSC